MADTDTAFAFRRDDKYSARHELSLSGGDMDLAIYIRI